MDDSIVVSKRIVQKNAVETLNVDRNAQTRNATSVFSPDTEGMWQLKCSECPGYQQLSAG